MKLSKQLMALASILVGLLFSPLTWAQEGRIAVVSGGVTIERGDQVLIAKTNSLLQAGDVLVTDIDGRVLWQMADEAYFVMPSNGRFQIKQHNAPASSSGSGEVHYVQQTGGARTHTGLVSGKSGEYLHETPAASLQANGTDYIAILVDAARAADLGVEPGLYVMVKAGNVVMSNQGGSLSLDQGGVGFAVDQTVEPIILPDAPDVLISLFLSQDFDFTDLTFDGDVEIRPPGDGDGDGDGDPSPS